MNERRAFLKDLAARSADAWAKENAATTPSFRGETRVETKNTIYQFRDGTCVAVTRHDSGWRADPTVFIGMRLVGWLAYDDPSAGLIQDWRPGAYAVLWRSRKPSETHASVALTSATISSEQTTRPSTPPPLPLQRPSTLTRVHEPSAQKPMKLMTPARPILTPLSPALPSRSPSASHVSA